MSLAVSDDVEASLMRPLTAAEGTYVAPLLDRAETIIIARLPDAVAHAGEDSEYHKRVVQVEADMVARVFRNPDGMKNEGDGTYSYAIDWTVASGRLKLLDDDLELLGQRRGVGSLRGELDGYARARMGDVPYSRQFETYWPATGDSYWGLP